MEFRILGPLEVEQEGRLLKLGGAQPRALLALLLLHANEVVPRDRLIEELWEGPPPETAGTAVQVHVSQLRKVLGRDVIVTQRPGYLVRARDGELDLRRFEEAVASARTANSAEAADLLREALALWRGSPLAELGRSFAQGERSRLEEARLAALAQRIDADLELGRHAELVPELEELVGEHPLRERLRGQLMVALYRSARQADALAVYQSGRRLLDDELGLEPGEELRRLERAILAQDASLSAPAQAARLPAGTVTFLFTDIEGSTRLLAELGQERYADLLTEHRAALLAAIQRHGGVEVDRQGDAVFAAFSTAPGALAAANDGQAAFEDGRVRVRMGVHTGTPLVSGDGYVGLDVHRAARIAAAAHGGQVVVSSSTASLVDGDLRDLGEHRFKDLAAAERVYQLGEGEFPPLRSLYRTNLPVPAWPLLGRERELEEIGSLIRDGAPLVTLTGTGGSGKTRLAVQAAAELSDEFPDGVFFAGLSPLRDASKVRATVAETVGLRPDDDVAAWLGQKRVLLVLDNLEHLEGVDTVVAGLLSGETAVLATSRAPLHLSAERELPVDPLLDEAAVELFVSRAAAAGRRVLADATVGEVCRRLDNLPLALELAAARSKLLAPAALLQRLDAALPLLTGGAGDRPERQRTLRATIEWSHDLLDPETQAAFRRLSVFRGSFTLDSAEAVAGAVLEQVGVLLDQSLVKPLGEERFFLLETIREYARERLEQAGETNEYALRHARFYLARLEHDEPDVWGARRSELMAWFAAEEDNLRAMLDRLTADSILEAARATHLLHRYWFSSAAHAEERQRHLALLARDDLPKEQRAILLGCLAELEGTVGDVDAMEAAAHEALPLTTPGSVERAFALRNLAFSAVRLGRTDEAVRRCRQLLEEAEALDERRRNWMRGDVADILADAGSVGEARALTREFVDECRRIGDGWAESFGIVNLAEFDLIEHEYEAARAALAAVLEPGRVYGDLRFETRALRALGYALLGLDRRSDARATFAGLLDLATQDSTAPAMPLADAADGIAVAAEPSDAPHAARLRGAVANLRRIAHLTAERRADELERRFEQPLIDALGRAAWEREHAAGADMTVEETLAYARSLATPVQEPAGEAA